jgi:hypothetical protein
MGLQGNSEPLGGHWQYLVMGQPSVAGLAAALEPELAESRAGS